MRRAANSADIPLDGVPAMRDEDLPAANYCIANDGRQDYCR
jgi:hypothetical protein